MPPKSEAAACVSAGTSLIVERTSSLPVVAQIDCELTLAGSSGVNFEADSQDSARIRTSTGAEQEVRPFREITCVPQKRMSNGNT